MLRTSLLSSGLLQPGCNAVKLEIVLVCKTLLNLIMAGRAWEQAGPSLKADLTKDAVLEIV